MKRKAFKELVAAIRAISPSDGYGCDLAISNPSLIVIRAEAA